MSHFHLHKNHDHLHHSHKLPPDLVHPPMGACHAKHRQRLPRDEAFKYKVMLLQEEVDGIMYMRDAEIQAYEREMMVVASKEAEWRKERKRLRGEVKMLKKRLEVKHKGVDNEVIGDGSRGKEGWASFLMEQARKDEAVEKWKKLYFDIKIELDDLIQRTKQGEGICWKAKAEEMVEELQKEVMAKEKTVELQQSQIASMKQEECKKEREIDILRQSLKIVCHSNKCNNNNESKKTLQDAKSC